MTIKFNAGEVITAMVTPFTKDGNVDYDKAGELASYLIDNGTDSILVAATTGECPTLAHDEESELLSTVKRAVRNECKVIMSAGSNSTQEAIKYAKTAEKEGADAILSVAPYYNKPSQEGLKAHFAAIAQAVNIPIILYNIPSRTGVNIEPETDRLVWSGSDKDIIAEGNIQINRNGEFIATGDKVIISPDYSHFKIKGNTMSKIFDKNGKNKKGNLFQ